MSSLAQSFGLKSTSFDFRTLRKKAFWTGLQELAYVFLGSLSKQFWRRVFDESDTEPGEDVVVHHEDELRLRPLCNPLSQLLCFISSLSYCVVLRLEDKNIQSRMVEGCVEVLVLFFLSKNYYLNVVLFVFAF